MADDHKEQKDESWLKEQAFADIINSEDMAEEEKDMRKIIILLVVIACLLLALPIWNQKNRQSEGESKMNLFLQISPEEAYDLMKTQKDYVILDVREQYEFDAGHIPGAVVLPYTGVEEKAEAMLPDRNQLILVYCRSGRRSQIAAKTLSDMGYTNVQEFGGIVDWPYEITQE